MLVSAVTEVEHFPWGVVNNLAKVSPHMLQSVDVALWLSRGTEPFWATGRPISSDKYEAYFRQVRSALPELDIKVVMSVVLKEVCSSSQLFAGLILIINSSSIFYDAIVCGEKEQEYH
jgi:hypothetical protein